ncbi:hypothetical protein PAXRUDRAFT_833458 [Paxillus rubicundulus Ve08.2h10]|uniref:Uncharacterized protein n=1 Tax=Paxillus rubicundulus Ve08.2h10 TaxID=930991 RepID=A0A0D0CCR1_9AGAM|nr:hypothetical protein PAXRUDRAFT_833458 [Paxillus rubicundulus Ve08.2h10]
MYTADIEVHLLVPFPIRGFCGCPSDPHSLNVEMEDESDADRRQVVGRGANIADIGDRNILDITI